VARVRALVGDTALCSWARHFTLTVPLSTQVYKWEPANLTLWVLCDRQASHPGGSRDTPNRFMPLKQPSTGLIGHLAPMQTLPL